MSHIVTIKTRVTDPVALAAACARLGLETPTQGTATLFSAEASGLIVKLPGWHYPVVVDTASGETKFDNYNEAWGKQAELDKLLQSYAIEKTRIEARRAGHTLTEQRLDGGAVKLTIQVGGTIGGAA
jgi:hypothetical protein